MGTDDTQLNQPPQGVALIKDQMKRLPSSPGVYRMLGEHNDVLYVGKAKSLIDRVSSYSRLGGHNQRIASMIMLTRGMEFVVTETESEALLLEASLIKSLKPRFNVLLRDDKSFPYILIKRDLKNNAPQIVKYRGTKKEKGDYFGPFASVNAVRQTLDLMQKAFLLRTCDDSIFETRSRPCMLHQIKRCSAPCVGVVTAEEYGSLVTQAKNFLKGKATDLQKQMAEEMEVASESLNFEKAAMLRDRIRALAHVRSKQDIGSVGIEDIDIFAVANKGGASCVQVFFIRAGQNWGTHAFYPKHQRDAEPQEIITAFVAQFYEKRPPPRLIITNVQPNQGTLLADALSLSSDKKVKIECPKRGRKRELILMAQRNAEAALARKLAESGSQQKLLQGVAETFKLPTSPDRIEIYDNSHIQGTNAVGAMVVAGPEGFMKNQYRKFNIKDEELEPGDDFGMMREVFRRRFLRAIKERNEDNVGNWPDLVLIDGGPGQLSAVIKSLEDIGLTPDDVPMVAIAKGPDRNAGREQFYLPNRPPFRLPDKSPVLYYLQRLRDEAHRWAIGAHRARRTADAKRNPLDEIKGVGPTRKKALLHRFGSAKAVSQAKLADIASVEGINTATAEKIFNHFRGG